MRDPIDTAAMIALGRAIFFDPALSASGRTSCATCHDPRYAYAAPNSLAVQLGGPDLDQQGARAVPSLRYVLPHTPRYYKEYVSNLAERIREGDEPPIGGFGLDGRFASAHEQAEFPLLAPNEMANANWRDVAAKLARAPYAAKFRRSFGARIFDTPHRAYALALEVIELFELRDSTFAPYDSKYDLYLDGRAKLTAQEKRGMALFNDPRQGNCATCHLDVKGADGSHPLFTDFQFDVLGVPRNPEISANRDSTYFDEGLCGPARTDQRDHREYCGMFKTPTLRNVATRRAFFHNGRFHSLRDALRFYVTRDTDPGRWYPHGTDGRVEKFDDLPHSLRANVDVRSTPLDRSPGQKPAWSESDIDDVIAFLETLTDSYDKQRAP